MELRNVSFKIPAELRQQIELELEAQGWTVGHFFELAAQGYFNKEKGGNNMGTTRTLAFTVSEELFEKVKEYLAWYQRKYGRRLTQKEFMVGLLEDAIEEMEADVAEHQTRDEAAGSETQEDEDGEDASSAPENATEGDETDWPDEGPEGDKSPTDEEIPIDDTGDAEGDQGSPGEDIEDEDTEE